MSTGRLSFSPLPLRRWALMAVFALAGGGLLLLAVDLRLPMVYSVQVKFATLPETDDALEAWLRTQPGVGTNIVHRPERGFLAVQWVSSQTNYHAPITPDLRPQLERLGYLGPTEYRELKGRLDK